MTLNGSSWSEKESMAPMDDRLQVIEYGHTGLYAQANSPIYGEALALQRGTGLGIS